MDARVETGSPGETEETGKRLGKQLAGGEVITLSGPLGAGKTSLARGIGEALGIPAETVTSPTFILRAEHPEGKFPLAHIDLYRLEAPGEIRKLGLLEQEDPKTVLLVEWPERGTGALPEERLEITIEIKDSDKRIIRMKTTGGSYPHLSETPLHEK